MVGKIRSLIENLHLINKKTFKEVAIKGALFVSAIFAIVVIFFIILIINRFHLKD